MSQPLLFVFSLEDQPEDDGDETGEPGGEVEEVGDGGGGAEKENMKPCRFCRRPFRKERIAKHEEACKKKAKAIGRFWTQNTGPLAGGGANDNS